jgi:Icc protein
MHEPLLIAQISDTHITYPGERAYPQVDTAGMLQACVEQLQAFRPRPDLLLITGDLVERGQREEYQHFRALLAPLGDLPTLIIAGNHDDRAVLRAVFPDAHYLPAQGFLQYAVDRGPLRFIGLDTLIPGEGGGKLCDERLAWLEATLAECPERPTLVLMHHPPFETGIAHIDRKALLGREAYAALLERHPQVVATLCGHLHRMIVVQIAGRPAMTIPSPAHQIALNLGPAAPTGYGLEPPGFLLHQWNGVRLASHAVSIGRFPGPYPFRP